VNVYLFTETDKFVGVEGEAKKTSRGNWKVRVNLTPERDGAWTSASEAARVGHLVGKGSPTLASRPSWNFNGLTAWRDQNGKPLQDLGA